MTTSRLTWISISIAGLGFLALIFTVGAISILGEDGILPIFNPPSNPVSTLVSETPTAAPAVIEGLVWHDICAAGSQKTSSPGSIPAGCVPLAEGFGYHANGISEPGEPGFDGISVRLGSDFCPSIGLMTSTTDALGGFRFTGLPAGSYCVSIWIHG